MCGFLWFYKLISLIAKSEITQHSFLSQDKQDYVQFSEHTSSWVNNYAPYKLFQSQFTHNIKLKAQLLVSIELSPYFQGYEHSVQYNVTKREVSPASSLEGHSNTIGQVRELTRLMVMRSGLSSENNLEDTAFLQWELWGH